MSTITSFTAEELLRMPKDGCRYELISGELKTMSPAGWRHGDVGGALQGILAEHIRKHKSGKLFLAETGFLLSRDPDTVRAPDIAFVHKDHLPKDLRDDAYWPGPPDLAVEVVSPSETYREVDEKANAWLAAGARLVWIVNPLQRTVSIYRAGASVETLTGADHLTGGDVLSGFRCEVSDIFAGQ